MALLQTCIIISRDSKLDYSNLKFSAASCRTKCMNTEILDAITIKYRGSKSSSKKQVYSEF